MVDLFTTNSIKKAIYATIILSFPVYTWLRYLRKSRKLKEEYNERKLHHKKHNCVVIYSKKSGIFGWPGFTEKVYKPSIKDIRKSFEPLCYFITTAEKSLDIATMMMNSDTIFEALISSVKRGVKIRFLLDYAYTKRNSMVDELHKRGVEIYYFISEANVKENMFHYKYAVKDYCKDGGYVCCSSINWTSNAFIYNYENIVFTTNKSVVKSFHENFEEALCYMKHMTERNAQVKAQLMLHNLI